MESSCCLRRADKISAAHLRVNTIPFQDIQYLAHKAFVRNKLLKALNPAVRLVSRLTVLEATAGPSPRASPSPWHNVILVNEG